MIFALIVGLVIGFFVSIPPGPIAVAVMKQALDGKFRPGIQIGVGASTMDTIYSLIAIFASTAIVGSLRHAFTMNGWVMLGFQIACITTLVVLGLSYFKVKTKDVAKEERREMEQEERARKMGFSSPYLIGIIMSITNLATPTFLPTVFGIAGYLHANNYVDNSVGECVLYALGFGSGAALWFVVLLRTMYKWRTKISENFVARIYVFAGWSFIIFAAILALRIAIGTDWSTFPH